MAIQSLKKTFDILALFSFERPRLGVTEIAEALGLPKTTTSSLVRTMAQLGVLDQDPQTRRYGLGARLFKLGVVAGETLEINQKSAGPARQLARQTGLDTRVAIWDEDAALVVHDLSPSNDDFLNRRIGPRIVAHCTSLGRVLLAFAESTVLEDYLSKTELKAFTPHTITDKNMLIEELSRTIQRGHAINNQELTLGSASIAAPIFKTGGHIAASIGLVGSPRQVLEAGQEDLVIQIKQTAEEISWQLGHRPKSPQ